MREEHPQIPISARPLLGSAAASWPSKAKAAQVPAHHILCLCQHKAAPPSSAAVPEQGWAVPPSLGAPTLPSPAHPHFPGLLALAVLCFPQGHGQLHQRHTARQEQRLFAVLTQSEQFSPRLQSCPPKPAWICVFEKLILLQHCLGFALLAF